MIEGISAVTLGTHEMPRAVRIFAAMPDLKPQRAVESDGSWHFVGAECDCANPLDHGQNSPVSFPRAVATGPKLATGGGRSTHRAGASGFAISARRLASFQISAN